MNIIEKKTHKLKWQYVKIIAAHSFSTRTCQHLKPFDNCLIVVLPYQDIKKYQTFVSLRWTTAVAFNF